jgi:hypothetical protein
LNFTVPSGAIPARTAGFRVIYFSYRDPVINLLLRNFHFSYLVLA